MAAALTIIASFFGLLFIRGPGRWIWQRLVADPLTKWNEQAALEGINRKINGDLEHLQATIETLVAGQTHMRQTSVLTSEAVVQVREHLTDMAELAEEMSARIAKVEAARMCSHPTVMQIAVEDDGRSRFRCAICGHTFVVVPLPGIQGMM